MYQTVFDVSNSSFQGVQLIFMSFSFACIGFYMYRNRLNTKGWWGRHPKAYTIFLVVFVTFSLTILILGGGSSCYNYWSLQQRLKSGNYSVVEGVVEKFVPMPKQGHAMESFCVKNTCFRYSDFIVTGGFNNTSSHGGPIHEDLIVKISYIGDVIIKLEIRTWC